MTTPQNMPTEEPSTVADPVPEERPAGILYTFATKLVAWIAFMCCLSLLVGLLVFTALGLYRGILWLWPGGELG